MSTFLQPSFTGPPVATHTYLLPCREGNLLIDAPQGAASFLHSTSPNTKIDALLITHAHFDHIWDATSILEQHQCELWMSRTTEEILANQDLFKHLDFGFEIPALKATRYLKEAEEQQLLGENFTFFEVPGHCPGSLALYWPQEKVLYSGDTLFKGMVGRWDLPGGNKEELLLNIKKKLLSLPEETIVLPGHGGGTSVKEEKMLNTYFL